MTDFGAAFKLPFTNWKRLLLLAALTIAGYVLPILPVAGFYAQILRFSMRPDQSSAALPSFAGINWVMFAVLGLVALVIWLVLFGYFLRVAGYAARGRNELPQFKDALGMVTMSLKAIAGFIVYYVITALILFPIVMLTFSPIPVVFRIIGGLLLVAFILAAFLAVYVLSVVVVGFAAENRFLALFSFRRGLRYAFTAAFFVPWVVGIGYSLGLSYIGQLVMMVPVYSLMFTNGIVAAILIAQMVYVPVILIGSITSLNLEGQGYYGAALARKAKK